MNKILLIVNAALAVAIGVLFYQVNNAKSDKPSVAVTKNAATMPVTSKIAYFNTDTLTLKYEFIKEKNKVLQDEERRLNGNIEAKTKALQNRYLELQQRAQTMTEKEIEAASLELRQAEQAIGEMKQKAAMDLEKQNIALLKELYSKLDSFLKKYNEEQKFDYILKYEEGGFIAYGKDALDITSDVLNGLNEEYAASKKK